MTARRRRTGATPRSLRTGSGHAEPRAEVQRDHEARHAKGHPIAGRVALPLVESAVAFAAGDYEGTPRHLEPVESEIHRMGGSHAQWEIFEETMIGSYLRTGPRG